MYTYMELVVQEKTMLMVTKSVYYLKMEHQNG